MLYRQALAVPARISIGINIVVWQKDSDVCSGMGY